MSGSSKHRLVMAVVWLSLTVGSALGAWKNDEPLTHGGGPLLGNPVNVRMAWNPVTGRIGLVYLETQPSAQALTYVEWKPGEGVVLSVTMDMNGPVDFLVVPAAGD